MADIVLPHTITAGTLADATQVQANFAELADKALNKTGDTMEGALVTQVALPDVDATRDLGSATYQYKDLYLSGSVIGPSGANAFGTVAVSGQSDVVADSSSDTLTLAAGIGITLTTTPGTDTVTITNSGTTQAGGSAVNFKGGGILYNGQTDVGNVGIGEDTLISKTIAANVLSADGAALTFVVGGTWATNTNDKTIKVKFGATTIAQIGPGNYVDGTVVFGWSIRGTIVRRSASTQICTTTFDGASGSGSGAKTTSAGETLSSTVNFVVTGEATSDNDIVCKFYRISYEPDSGN